MLWLLVYILRNELMAIQNSFPCGNLTIMALEQPTATGNKQQGPLYKGVEGSKFPGTNLDSFEAN